jgi:hypothetical protein
MNQHRVTSRELDDFLNSQWVVFASSGSDLSHKRLEVGLNGMYRVKERRNIVYYGNSEDAIETYNNLP